MNPEPVNPSYDVYDHAGRTRATIRGFIKYLIAYKQDQQKKSDPWTLNPEPYNPEPLLF